jgi:hypothetical protein
MRCARSPSHRLWRGWVVHMLKEILLLSTILPVDSWQNVKDMLDINTLPINYYKGIIIESKK